MYDLTHGNKGKNWVRFSIWFVVPEKGDRKERLRERRVKKRPRVLRLAEALYLNKKNTH